MKNEINGREKEMTRSGIAAIHAGIIDIVCKEEIRLRLSPAETDLLLDAAGTMLRLWADRKRAREQFCLASADEDAGRGIRSSPEEIAAEMGWPVAHGELDLVEKGGGR
jgi:hypothetical protein